MKKRNKDFYYTKELMVKDLIKLIPFKKGKYIYNSDSVLDAGSGANKVWFSNIPKECNKYECEIEHGCNFYEWKEKVDWVIGNPPFHDGWNFINYASILVNKGIAFLGNINFFNCLTTKRLDELSKRGFNIQKIHVINDKRWFGRYYFIIFEKKNSDFVTWNNKTY